MMTQTEMFATSEIDDAKLVLAKLQGDWEKADKSVQSAEEKRDYIRFLVGKQERVIERLRVSTTIEIRELEPIVGVNEETGEVVGGEQEEAEAVREVLVRRPGWSAVTVTPVGERTRFGELVADYINESGGDQDLTEFRVTGDDGLPRPLNTLISLDDYGREFYIEPVLVTEPVS